MGGLLGELLRSADFVVSETWARLYVVFSPKVKIVWSMLQMLTLLGICFGVQWPAQYEEVVRAVEEGVNLNFLKLVTVSCWQEWTWHHTLLLRTLAPSALILLLMGVVVLARLANGRRKGGGDVVVSVASIAWRAPRSLQNVSPRWSAGLVVLDYHFCTSINILDL